MSTAATPTDITFSDAYDQLKEITNTLNNEHVEADKLVHCCAAARALRPSCASTCRTSSRKYGNREWGRDYAVPDRPGERSSEDGAQRRRSD